MAYTASFIHECAHAGAALLLGIKPKEIQVGLLGMKLYLPDFIYPKEKLTICIAGPAFSFAVGLLIWGLGKIFGFDSHLYTFFMFSNFAIGFINILPALPLDGGAVIKAVLTAECGIINAVRLTGKISDIVYCIFGFAVFLMCRCKIFNPALTGIFCFLLLNRQKQKNIGIAEKNYVLSGKNVPGKRMKYIACDAESELLCLAGYISCDYTLIVAAFYKEKFFCDLNEYDIIRGIQKYGALCTVKEYAKGDKL